jgi:CBS domain-containing protein
VADYAGGKMDWLAHGLPYEGEADLVGRHLRAVPTCRPEELLANVARRVEGSPLCAVVSDDGIVIGVLDGHALAHHRDDRAGDVAPFGPTTVRPSEERRELEERMASKHVDRLLVTDPGGHLLGVYEAGAE